tara:strand:+ start:1412 stop:8209 length:6798 start_codon:yes stop_codon:yes gene_type:complete
MAEENKIDQYIENFLNGLKITGEESPARYIGQEGKRLLADLNTTFGDSPANKIALTEYYRKLLEWGINNGVKYAEYSTLLQEGSNLLNRFFPHNYWNMTGVEDIKFQNMIENATHIMTVQMDASHWNDYLNYIDYFNDHWLNQMENPTFNITVSLEDNIKTGEFDMPTMSDDFLMKQYKNDFLIDKRESLERLMVGEFAKIELHNGRYDGLYAVKNQYGTFDLYEPGNTGETNPLIGTDEAGNEIFNVEIPVTAPDEDKPKFTNVSSKEIYHEPMTRVERMRWRKINKIKPEGFAFGDTDGTQKGIELIDEKKYPYLDRLRKTNPGVTELIRYAPEYILQEINDNTEILFNLAKNKGVTPAQMQNLFWFAGDMLFAYDILPELTKTAFFAEFVDTGIVELDNRGYPLPTEDKDLHELVRTSTYKDMDIKQLMELHKNIKPDILNNGNDILQNMFMNVWTIYEQMPDLFNEDAAYRRGLIYDQNNASRDYKPTNTNFPDMGEGVSRINYLRSMYIFPVINAEFKPYQPVSFNETSHLYHETYPYEQFVEDMQMRLASNPNSVFTNNFSEQGMQRFRMSGSTGRPSLFLPRGYDADVRDNPITREFTSYVGPPQNNLDIERPQDVTPMERNDAMLKAEQDRLSVLESQRDLYANSSNASTPEYKKMIEELDMEIAELKDELIIMDQAGEMPTPEELSGERSSFDITMATDDEGNQAIDDIVVAGADTPSPQEILDNLSRIDSQLTDNEKKVKDIEEKLYERYKEFIAEDPGDTEPFSVLKGADRPPFELTVLNDKFLVIDLLTIDPAKQGGKAGSAIVAELIQWAARPDIDMHVIAVPVSSRVEEVMIRNGAQWIESLEHFYFGWRKDEALELSKERFASQNPAMITAFDKFIKETLELDDEMRKVFIEGMDGAPIVDVVEAIFKKEVTNPSELISFIDAIPAQQGEKRTGLFDYIVPQRHIDRMRNIRQLPSYADDAIKWSEWYDSIGFASRNSMDYWITNSVAGQRYLLSLLERFNRKPNTDLTPEQFQKALSDEIAGLINYKLDDKTIDRYNSGRATPFDQELGWGTFANDIDAGVSDELADLIYTTIYLNDEREKVVFDMIDAAGNEFPISPIAQVSQNESGPLRIQSHGEQERMVFYRGMSNIDAALGLRETNVLGQGSSASGFGRASYFTSSANYANSYNGRHQIGGSGVYAVSLDINDLRLGMGSIINLDHKIMFYPELIDHFNKLAQEEYIDINNPAHRRKTIGEVWRALGDFKGTAHEVTVIGSEGLQNLVNILKNDYGYQIIINNHTGPSGPSTQPYLDATGFVESARLHSQWRGSNGAPMPVDEIIIIDTEGLKDKLILEGKVKPETIGFNNPVVTDKPYLEDVVQTEINGLFERAQYYEMSEKGTAVHILTGLEELKIELKMELNNRSEDVFLTNIGVVENLETLYDNAKSFILENGGYDNVTALELANNVQYRNMAEVVRVPTQGIWDPRTEQYIDLKTLAASYQSAGPNHLNHSVRMKVIDKNGNVQYEDFLIDVAKLVGPEGWTHVADAGVPVIDRQGVSDVLQLTNSLEMRYIVPENYQKYIRRFNQERIRELEQGKPLLQQPGLGKEAGRLSPEFRELLNRPDTILEFNITHASPFHQISINDIQGGFDHMVPVINRTTGEVTFRETADSRNRQYHVGLSTSFEDDIIFNKYSSITGKGIGNPARNYFTIRINSDSVLTQMNVMDGSWFDKFDINGAAKAMGVPPAVIFEGLVTGKLLVKSDYGRGYYSPTFSNRRVGDIIHGFETAATVVNRYLTNRTDATFKPIDVTRMLRGGGIEAFVDNPNMWHGNFEEFILLDPNDQAGVGRAVDIIDIDEETYRLNPDNYSIISPAEQQLSPLRNYDEIDKNIKNTALDEAYDIRIDFETGFSNVEKEALGLTGDLPEFVAESVLSDDDARKIIEVGEAVINAPEALPLLTSAGTAIDLFKLHESAYDNLSYITALAEEEYHQIRGMLDADAKLLIKEATGPGGSIPSEVVPNVQAQVDELMSRIYPGLIDDSSKWKLIQKARNKLAYSIGLRGTTPTGLWLMDIWEIAVIGCALAYGYSDKWTVEFENLLKAISNGVFDTTYTMDTPGEVDYEKLHKAVLLAEKVSPTEWVLGPIIDDYRAVKYANSPGRDNTAKEDARVTEMLVSDKPDPKDILVPVQLGDSEIYVTGRQMGPHNPFSDGTISQGEGFGTWWSRFFDYQEFQRNRDYYNRDNEKKPDYFKADMFTNDLYSTNYNRNYWRTDY